MPATPKPPGARMRRNADQPKWRQLDATAPKPKAPTLPTKKPAWLKLTRDWWAAIWASPMATVWLPSDIPTLVRLARIVEADNRGDAAAGMLAEARQLEDRFGLSPLSRRRLQWEVAHAGRQDQPPGEALPVPSSAPRARLRAV